jgi:hypothetical protein
VISTLVTMTKVTNISMKNGNDTWLFGTYIKHDIDNTIVKGSILIALILTTKWTAPMAHFFMEFIDVRFRTMVI